MNSQPSNEIQHVILGDIDMLPLFSQWLQLELLDQQCFLWSADDQASAFNLYRLEDAWLPYLVPPSPRRSSAWEFLLDGAGRR